MSRNTYNCTRCAWPIFSTFTDDVLFYIPTYCERCADNIEQELKDEDILR